MYCTRVNIVSKIIKSIYQNFEKLKLRLSRFARQNSLSSAMSNHFQTKCHSLYTTKHTIDIICYRINVVLGQYLTLADQQSQQIYISKYLIDYDILIWHQEQPMQLEFKIFMVSVFENNKNTEPTHTTLKNWSHSFRCDTFGTVTDLFFNLLY